MWPFAPRQKPLREQVEEKRLSLQLQLLESASNLYDQFADPREAVFDDSSDFWPNAWSAHVPSNLDNSKRGENLPVYLNWYQLKVARDNSRRLCANNEFAINALENRISYIVGKGFKYQAVRRDNPETPENESGDGDDSLAREVNDYLREWMDGSDWESAEQEIARRCDCDGEVFIRFFETANGIEYRFIEPEHIQAPNESGPDTFGIQTDPDDVCTVLGYWVVEDPIEKRAPVLVPASEILHIRLNVNSAAKRGLPTFYPIRKNLERADKLLRNMSVLAQVQATFAVIRKHSGASASAVSAFQQAQADAMYSSPVTGNTKYLTSLQPGSIIDSNLQTEYEFPGGSINAASYVEILQAELRAIAARLVMPEYMLTADASNANFASTLVAESPSVKNFERLQSFYARKFGRGCYYQGKNSGVLWRVIVAGVESGKLNPQVLEEIEIQATGPSLTVRDRAADTTRYQTLNSARVLSKETWAQLEELDYEQEKRKLEQEPVDINNALLAVPEVGKPPKPEPGKAKGLKEGKWITIGSKKDAPEGEKGGSPVYINDSGEITKGHSSLVGKTVGELKGKKKKKGDTDTDKKEPEAKPEESKTPDNPKQEEQPKPEPSKPAEQPKPEAKAEPVKAEPTTLNENGKLVIRHTQDRRGGGKGETLIVREGDTTIKFGEHTVKIKSPLITVNDIGEDEGGVYLSRKMVLSPREIFMNSGSPFSQDELTSAVNYMPQRKVYLLSSDGSFNLDAVAEAKVSLKKNRSALGDIESILKGQVSEGASGAREALERFQKS